MSAKEICVVIGFRDWGLDRLAAAIKSHVRSTAGKITDVVVSDYGSEDSAEVLKVVTAAGGRVVRTERTGPWSRSRALNAGVRGTKTPYCITTDADMIFSKGCIENLLNMLKRDESAAHLIQCRDLEDNCGADVVSKLSDSDLEKNSFFRPRWGMGGLVAFRREAFDKIRGYDDRMEVYGGEDIDFANRLRRGGTRLNWVDDEATRIYHIWHPSTIQEVRNDPEQLRAQQLNRDIMLNDKTYIRNLSKVNIGGKAKPLASVAIATFNRADYLKESIDSVLSQTVQDFEVVVVDDGSSDHTQDVLSDIDDKRVRFFKQKNAGVATARNRLVSECRSDFIVVHDDDDLMLPDRIESHFSVLTDDVVGTYGGWIDFEHETGELTINQGRKLVPEGFIFTGKVLVHGASMFRREVLETFSYNEALKAGVDYHLIARMVSAGYKMQHTQKIHILRRFHDRNLTLINAQNQGHASRVMTNILRKGYGSRREAEFRKMANESKTIGCIGIENLQSNFHIYLPDHLATRSAFISALTRSERTALKKMNFSIGMDRDIVPLSSEVETSYEIRGGKTSDMPKLRKSF